MPNWPSFIGKESGRESSCSFEVVLRQAERAASRSGQQVLGLRAISFDGGSFEELDRVERSLRTRELLHDRDRWDCCGASNTSAGMTPIGRH
jgi:hypothetical protein